MIAAIDMIGRGARSARRGYHRWWRASMYRHV